MSFLDLIYLKRTEMHYFNFNIGDYASHTRHLSLMEDLAYRRLIDAYYLAEKPFTGTPADTLLHSKRCNLKLKYWLIYFFDNNFPFRP